MVDPIEIRITGKDDSGKALAEAEEGIKGVGDAGKKSGEQLKIAGEGIRGFEGSVKRASVGSADATTRLDRLGESADVGESRFIGLASGIDGATSLMSDPSPQEMAQGIADLSDGIAKAGVPWLIKLRDAAGNAISGMGGMKSVLVGGGTIAALGALGFVLADAAKEARNAKFDDIAKDLEETGDAAKAAKDALGDAGPDFQRMFSGSADDIGNLNAAVGRLVSDGNFDEARDLIAEAGERGDITAGQMEAYADKLDELENSSEGAALEQRRLADSIRGTNDAVQAATDPVFALIDADNQLRDANQAVADAQTAVNDAIKEHGEGSPEHVEALQNLRDAELDVSSAVYDNEAAMRDLAAAMVEGGGDTNAMISHLRGLERQGKVAKGTTDAFANAVRDIPRRADTTIRAHDFASTVLDAAGDRARRLDGTIADIFLQASWIGGGSAYAAFTGRTRAAGGPISTAAGGGARGPGTLMHEQGPEVTFHPDGSMVIPAGASRGIMQAAAGYMGGGWGGGGEITINLVGGDNEFMRWLRSRIHAEGGDVQDVLGSD